MTIFARAQMPRRCTDAALDCCFRASCGSRCMSPLGYCSHRQGKPLFTMRQRACRMLNARYTPNATSGRRVGILKVGDRRDTRQTRAACAPNQRRCEYGNRRNTRQTRTFPHESATSGAVHALIAAGPVRWARGNSGADELRAEHRRPKNLLFPRRFNANVLDRVSIMG